MDDYRWLVMGGAGGSGDAVGPVAAPSEQPWATLDRLPAGFQLLGFDWTYLYLNDAVARQARRTKSELVGRSMLECFPGIDAMPVFAALASCMQGRFGARLTNTWTYPDGETRWFELQVEPCAQGLCVLSIDVTERHRAEHALRESEARLATLIDTIVDGVVSIDEKGIVTSFNHAAERIFGYREDEVVGRNVKLLMPAPYHDEHDGYIARYRETGEAKIIGIGREVQGRRKDGTTFPLELAIGEARIGGERFFTGILRDVSERKRLEREFREAQKMEALGTLTGGIAHDYNNLLMGLLGCMELALQHVPAASPAREYLEQGRQAASRGASLTRQLLTFSRRREGKPTAVALDPLLASLEGVLRSTLGERVRLRLELGASEAQVRGDMGQLEQVLFNLVVNARDAMPEGGDIAITTSRVSIGAGADLPPGDYLMLRVADTGVGMDAETRARIFEPFFTTKAPERGTGLGLATVWSIVREAGGKVDVESELGRGTTFSLYLQQVASGAPEPLAPKLPLQSGSETILVVDDDPLVRLAVRGYLEPLGYAVLQAADANEASLLLQRERGKIDLVITDMMLPGATGPDVAAEAERHRPGTPIVFMSAYGREALSDRIPLPDGAILLQKPFDASALGVELTRIFGGRRPSSRPAPVASASVARAPALAPVPTDGATLLLVEDGGTTRAAMKELLELAGYRVLAAASGKEALGLCEAHADGINAIVTDVGLPDMAASELVGRLRSRLPEVALVYVSGKSEDDREVQALPRGGRTTFVQKPVEVASLARTIAGLLRS